MANTLRKRLGPMSVVATIAVMGLLAAFIALAAMPDGASAQDGPVPPPLPAETPPPTDQPASGPQPPGLPVEDADVTGGEPSSYVIEGPDFVIQSRQDTSRYAVDVLDANGDPANFDLRPGSEIVTVYLDVVDTAQGDVSATASCLPPGTDAVAMDHLGNTLNGCSFRMDVSGNEPWFEIMATNIPHGTDVGISLVVDNRPVGDTHTVSYLDPAAPTPTPLPTVEPQEGMSDAATVVSYNDWEHHLVVTDGYILRDPNGRTHMVNDMHNQTGWLHRDEPVNNRSYALGNSEREMLTVRENVQAGQHTVEVLQGASDVQLTVTATIESPVYIRLTDSNGDAIGLDVDEAAAERGLDVVGLDSHGRLELSQQVSLSVAKALAYDQYNWHIPSNTTLNAYLEGKAGQYNQGTFRVIDPCPRSDGEGLAFSVEVWNQDGTYLQTTEEIHCINPDPLNPSELNVTTFSDRPGVAVLRWEAALGSVAHHVLVADATTLQIVPGTYHRVDSSENEYEFTGLSANVPYIFAVVGERGENDFSNPSFIIQEMTWDSTQ